MSLAGLFAATAALVGATTMVGAVRHRLAVRRRRRERERRRQARPTLRLNRTATLSPPLRVLVADARMLVALLEHTRHVGDEAWARASVARQGSVVTGLDRTAGHLSPHASYVAALGDALRATSSFLALLNKLPSAEAEIVADRGVMVDALRRLVSERATPAHYAEGGDGLLSSTVPEAIDEMEKRLDAAIDVLEQAVAALTSDHRRPYR